MFRAVCFFLCCAFALLVPGPARALSAYGECAQPDTNAGALPAAFSLRDMPPAYSSRAADDSLPLPMPGVRAHLYRMNYWFTASFILGGTAANIYAIPRLIKNKRGLSAAELAAVNPDAVPGFDRWAIRQDPNADIKRPDKISDYILNGVIVGSLALGFDKGVRSDALRLALLYAETQVATFALYDFSFFGPAFQNKLRPIVYYPSFATSTRQEGNNRNSFYSGHVANAASATFCAAKILNDYHPEWSSTTKYLLYGAAAVPPLAVAYLRVKALKHFPSDNLVGLLIGGACGIIVPELHRIKNQAIEISTVGTPVGPGLSLTYKLGIQQGPATATW